jgi:hypothetical protein
MEEERTYTVFAANRLIASGPLDTVLPRLKTWTHRNASALPLIFDDQTGKQVDFDLRGSAEEALARALPAPSTGPGRPRLGVVSREVSLLPRHWEWLEDQPNGASAALRRLVDEARKHEPEKQRKRRAQAAAGRALSALAGDLPDYEEASRALYAGDRDRFASLIRTWPADVRAYALRLTEAAL